ncbi:MAG: hypothetical protein QNK37_24660 [Acidobacteriota bacterium]|nr:hypothetical protein [Acidobacteriota bacterium]
MRFLVLLLTGVAFGGNFELGEGLPSGAWDNVARARDAVILSSKLRIDETEIHHYRLIRVITEQGKAAANRFAISSNMTMLKGRVVDRDGRETHFDQDADMLEVLAYQTAGGRATVRYVLPPGLTTDCIVEMTWSEEAKNGLPKDQFHSLYLVSEPWYCKEKVFMINNDTLEIASKSRFSDDDFLHMVTRLFWGEIRNGTVMTQGVVGDYTQLTFKDIPPLDSHPYGAPGEDPNMVSLQIFRTLPFQGANMRSFWADYANNYVKLFYDYHYEHRDDYKRWIAAVRERMPEETDKAARFVYKAFRHKIKPLDLMTPAERRAFDPNALVALGYDLDMVDHIFKRGFASRFNMGPAMFEVMRDCGLPVQLGFTTPDNRLPVVPQEMNPFVLDIANPILLFSLDEKRKLTLAPGYPELDVGDIPSHFRGQLTAVIDPADKDNWKTGFLTLPRRSWKSHRLIQSYKLSVDTGGTVNMTLQEQGSGAYNASFRRIYRPLGSEAARELLAKEWSDRLPAWRISGAGVGNADDFSRRIARNVRAGTKLDIEGLDWFSLAPLPGSQPLFEIPEVYPDDRKQPVILPENKGMISRAEITLPKGLRLLGNPSWKQKNSFGEISFQVTSKSENIISVERRMILVDGTQAADKIDEFKYFVTWMQEAVSQTIAVGRGE